MKKYFLLTISLFVIACGGGSETNTPVKPPVVEPPVIPPVVEPPITDLGTSKYADDDVYNDVMMQSFWWDTYTDSKITSVGTFYQFMSSKLIDISNAHIDVVWLPPTSEGEGMGYHPRQLFNFNSAHGSETQLRTLLTAIKGRKIHGMADLVFNHRIGTSNWNDFTNPAWSCDAICINDEGYTNPSATGTRPCGDLDEGEGWSGARDLNHKSMDVRNGLKDYLLRLKDLGFDSWRYDFVKGFPAKYVGEYNSSTPYYYSVGEYWEGNAYAIKNWVDGTGNTVSGTTEKSGAFDFDLKYKLGEAIVKGNYSYLINAGLAGIAGYKEKSVTFLDNHDSGCINRTDCGSLFSNSTNYITMGYAYLLTHPGIPMIWGYHYFFQDPTFKLKTDIKELIVIRKELGINARSTVEILNTVNGANGYYAAKIDNKLIIKIGPGTYAAPDATWKVKKTGNGYTIWTL